MKHLALDLWDDLRAKRLWPVAGALLLAVIAIPVLVMKPAEDPSPAGAGTAPAQPPAQPPAAVVDDASGRSSHLGVFGRKDPFRPPAAALKPSTSAGAASAASAVAGAAPSAPSPSPESTTTQGSAAPASPGGSGASTSSGGGSAPAPSPPTRRPRTAYTYVIDVDFGPQGHVRRRRGVPRLEVLPSEQSPVAVFLGVSASGERAVFMLNPALKQRGQGTCRPSRARCAFLHLSSDPARNGHHVVGADGVTYVLRLKAIRRVTVRAASRSSSRGPRARAGAKRAGSRSTVFADEQR